MSAPLASGNVSVDAEAQMYDAIFVGARCAGIRGHGRDGRPVEEHSRMVIRDEGANSFVARAERAPEYDVRPVAACGYN